MKPPSFWYPPHNQQAASLLSDVLLPLSCAFRAGTKMRKVFATPLRSRVPVICVGNAVAGGAGKTPTALALARILKDRGQKPVFVTRGYGGHGQLTHVNADSHRAEDVGDEALLLAAHAPTWAGVNRVTAIRHAESHGTVIIMDDGLQNPHIAPTSSILVIDGDVGIGNKRVIPAGPLREPFEAALKRVAAVVIIGREDRQNLAAKIKAPVFRAQIQPAVSVDIPKDIPLVAFAGIARPEKFYATAREMGLTLAETHDFPDHHLYTESDMDALRLRAETLGARLLTTEKDAVRFSAAFRAQIMTLPVKLVFDGQGAEAEIARLCISSCAL